MARSSKSAPTRKPIKARGALPTPKISPKRVQRHWYNRRDFQIVAVVIFLVAAVLATRAVLEWREAQAERKAQVRQVKAFENKVQLLQSPMQEVFRAVNTAPNELQAGTLPPDEFTKQTEVWLEKFRELDLGLRERQVPPDFKSLLEIRAMLVQGTVVYIDAVKHFQAAAALSDPAIRAKAIKDAQSTFSHGTSVFGNGQRELAALKVRLGMEEHDPENPLLGPIVLPQEVVPDAPSTGGDPSAGQLPPGVQPQGGQLPPQVAP